MQKQLLLLEDIHGVGRKGDVVKVKPGYARNFLVPQQKAEVATKQTLRKQERLKKEREEQAVKDRAESETLKGQIDKHEYETVVKVDHDGHMYGSVGPAEIVELVQEKDGIQLDRHMIRIGQPFKTLGTHVVPLRLKEGVTAEIAIKISPDRPLDLPKVEKEEPKKDPEDIEAQDETDA